MIYLAGNKEAQAINSPVHTGIQAFFVNIKCFQNAKEI